MSIGELSKQTGCKIETIRYYEKIGIMPIPSRGTGGHRIYVFEHVKRLLFIRRGRELGFSLQSIRDLLHLADRKTTSCKKVRNITTAHLEEVQGKINDLKSMEKVLADLVKRCKGRTIPDCPIIESLMGDNSC